MHARNETGGDSADETRLLQRIENALPGDDPWVPLSWIRRHYHLIPRSDRARADGRTRTEKITALSLWHASEGKGNKRDRLYWMQRHFAILNCDDKLIPYNTLRRRVSEAEALAAEDPDFDRNVRANGEQIRAWLA